MICASLLNNTGMRGKFYYLGEIGLLTLPRQGHSCGLIIRQVVLDFTKYGNKIVFFHVLWNMCLQTKQTSQEREFPLFNVMEDT